MAKKFEIKLSFAGGILRLTRKSEESQLVIEQNGFAAHCSDFGVASSTGNK